jgi:hypothetical protein
MSQTPVQKAIGANDPKPNLVIKAALTVVFLAVLWWLWMPLGAYMTILVVAGYSTKYISYFSLLWHPRQTFTVAVMFGLFMACIVCLSSVLAVSSWWSRALLEFWGLIAVAYIGSPPHISSNHPVRVSKNQLQFIGGYAIVTYLIASALLWVVIWLRRHP